MLPFVLTLCGMLQKVRESLRSVITRKERSWSPRLFLLPLLLFGTVAVSSARAESGLLIPPPVALIKQLAKEAYIWGLAPEFVYRFSAYQELVSAPVNTLKYGNNEAAWNNNGTNAGNASVLYINAFIDFNATAGEALVLTVPPTTGQFYVANYLDGFINGIGSIGNRTTPTSTAVSYVLVSPSDPRADDKTVTLGDGKVYPVMATDTNLNWLLIRIRANSLTDPSSSTSVASVLTNVVQKFALNTLTEFEQNGYTPSFPPSFDNITPTEQQVAEAAQWQTAPTNAVDFFTQVGDALVYSPLPDETAGLTGTLLAELPPQYIPQYGATSTYTMPSYDQRPTLALFAPIGLTANGFTIPSDWGEAEMAALEEGFQAGVEELQSLTTAGTAQPSTNYWTIINGMIGTYANTALGYVTRGIVVLAGGSANVPLDALYPKMDSNDGVKQLDGNNTYSITFTPPQDSYASYPVQGIFPPMVEQNGKVAGFWSIVVYQPDASSSSAPFITQTSVLNTVYSNSASTQVISVDAASDTLTVAPPAWGPIDLSTALIFGRGAAQYGLKAEQVYFVATPPIQSPDGTYSFKISQSWRQALSTGGVPIQQSGALGGSPGRVVNLRAGRKALTFGIVQPVSQLGSDQLDAGDLALNHDGSLTLWLSPTRPAGVAATNWIPTPSTAYYRALYGPKANVSTSIQAMIRMYYPMPGDQPPSILPYDGNTSTTYVLPPLLTRRSFSTKPKAK
jgi:hypothetical protein